MENDRNGFLCAFLFLLLAGLPTRGRAEMTLEFTPISDTSDVASMVAEQFTVVVTQTDGNVSFQFRNEGPITSVITSVYFQDISNILGAGAIVEEHLVDFAVDSSPDSPPGANPWWVEDWSADAVPAPPHNGISNWLGTGEQDWLVVAFDGDIGDIAGAIETGDFNIGLHVQTLGEEGLLSDSFTLHTPVPGAVVLGLLGLAYTGMKLRKHV